MHFKHVTVVGVGLIGGSFALAARQTGLAERITGWDKKDVLERARERAVIDDVEAAFEAGGVSDADLVYLAAPIGAILGFLRTRSSSIKRGAIVTDAGSTKREICRVAHEALSKEVSFVGGHPMAGSERSGIEFADANLFHGSPYALVDDGADGYALRAMSEVVSAIGGTPVRLSAVEHDRLAARISHAPQMLSTALALAVAHHSQNGARDLAGGGLADMTRLAKSDWAVWQDICRTNADEIAAAIDETISEIEAVRAAISSGELHVMSEMFREAKEHARELDGSPRSKAR